MAEVRASLRHPLRTMCYMCSDLRNDGLSKSGRASYAGRFIFIVGLPKSGTTWLAALVAEFPAFVEMGRSQLRPLDRSFLAAAEQDVTPELFASVPSKLCTILKLHTRWSESNMQVLQEQGIRPVILIRDLRDMMISRYYHIMAQPEHWMHETLTPLNFEEGFYRSLFWGDGGYRGAPYQDIDPITYWADWIRDWQAAAHQDPRGILMLHFEEMKTDLLQVLQKVSDFYELDLSKRVLEGVILRQARQQKKGGDLATNLHRPFREGNTFRKGLCGEWKKELSERHLAVFEQEAAGTMAPVPPERKR